MSLSKNLSRGYLGITTTTGGVFRVDEAPAKPVEYVNSSGNVVNNNTTASFTIPSGIQAGDLILAMVAGSNQSSFTLGTISLTGTDAANFTTDTSTNNHFIAYKYADGTESSRTLTANTTVSGRWGYLYFVCRNGVWSANVDKDFQTNINPSTNPTVSQTVAHSGGILVGLFGGDTNNPDVFVPSQYTELFRLSSVDADATAGYELIPDAGTYNRQWTSIATRAANGYINLAISNR